MEHKKFEIANFTKIWQEQVARVVDSAVKNNIDPEHVIAFDSQVSKVIMLYDIDVVNYTYEEAIVFRLGASQTELDFFITDRDTLREQVKNMDDDTEIVPAVAIRFTEVPMHPDFTWPVFELVLDTYAKRLKTALKELKKTSEK